MSQGDEVGKRYPIASLCGLFGVSRWGYYKHKEKGEEREVLLSSIPLYCRYLRDPDHLPGSGCRELYSMCRTYFGAMFTIGRDRFYDVMRANGLMLKKHRCYTRTTNSNHPYHIYEDLLNTTPKLEVTAPGQLVVADITYLRCRDGFKYLSMLTDGYIRGIVGYALHPTLETEGPIKALRSAMEFYKANGISTEHLIHHSDRGIQYASKAYTDILKENGIRISMTQTGDPLHNALAERMNNTIKNGWLFHCDSMSMEEAGMVVDNAVKMYNTARPHQSLNMKTPMQMLDGSHPNPLLAFQPPP